MIILIIQRFQGKCLMRSCNEVSCVILQVSSFKHWTSLVLNNLYLHFCWNQSVMWNSLNEMLITKCLGWIKMITFNRCDVQLNNRMILLLISLALHSLPTCPSLRDSPTVCEHVTYVLKSHCSPHILLSCLGFGGFCGWHSHLSCLKRKAHPSVWVFASSGELEHPACPSA